MGPVPFLSYDEALAVGADVQDYWRRRIGAAPNGRDEFGWADLVQFVTRKACERLAERAAAEEDCIPF